jgi:tetratricopeptide (TPR) repeat protein
VSDAARRSALFALDAARPAIARLDSSRDAEDQAADLIEGWSAVETALRSLLGLTATSPLAGQALIRETRQRQLITFEQANALAEFHAAAERAHRTDYRPNTADVSAARDGFLKMESALQTPGASPTAPPPVGRSAIAADTAPVVTQPEVVTTSSSRRGMPVWALAAIILVVVGGLGAAGWYFFSGGSSDSAYQRGVAYYARGQREAAVGELTKAVRDEPDNPMPHVYLSRMAREVGNLSLAAQEADAAVRLGPQNVYALREMGSYLLTAGNADLARKFFVRAVSADTSDKPSLGWLGCSLARLGRYQDAQRFAQRAGPGPWTNCVASPMPGMGPGQMQPLPNSPQGALPRP